MDINATLYEQILSVIILFSGWGLSMRKEDSFLKNFKPKQSMFDDGGIVNFKTLGMNLVGIMNTDRQTDSPTDQTTN